MNERHEGSECVEMTMLLSIFLSLKLNSVFVHVREKRQRRSCAVYVQYVYGGVTVN